jgi:hypothetical protein
MSIFVKILFSVHCYYLGDISDFKKIEILPYDAAQRPAGSRMCGIVG